MAVKYLVTGAAGYLGLSIVLELLAQGKSVRALVLPNDKAARHIPAPAEIVEGNLLSPDDLCKYFHVPEGTEMIVIHCAGIVSTAWNYSEQIFNVNVRGTQNIVNQCIKSKVKKLVYISSVHAIPELPKGQTITEITEFNPDKIIGAYAKTKARASQIVMDAANGGKLNAIIIFPSGLCGPYDYSMGYLTQLLLNCTKNRLPAGIEGGYDFADVRDVAKGVVAACEKSVSGKSYILANRYVPVKEIFQYVHELTGARLVKHMLPLWTARLLLPFFGAYYQIKNQTPLFTKYSLLTLTSNSNFSSEAAKREFGYTVRPFRQSVADTLQWLKTKGKI